MFPLFGTGHIFSEEQIEVQFPIRKLNLKGQNHIVILKPCSYWVPTIHLTPFRGTSNNLVTSMGNLWATDIGWREHE